MLRKKMGVMWESLRKPGNLVYRGLIGVHLNRSQTVNNDVDGNFRP